MSSSHVARTICDCMHHLAWWVKSCTWYTKECITSKVRATTQRTIEVTRILDTTSPIHFKITFINFWYYSNWYLLKISLLFYLWYTSQASPQFQNILKNILTISPFPFSHILEMRLKNWLLLNSGQWLFRIYFTVTKIYNWTTRKRFQQ